MKKSLLSLLFISAILVLSCKKELEPQESSGNPVPAVPVAEATPPMQVQAPPAMQQNVPVATQGQPQQVSMPAPPVKTAPGMNPPHGQPNHRCDIAVGAPLNSPVAKTAQTPQVIVPSPKMTPATGAPAILNPNTATATTAPGMNPPHGQEGHRCDVAVGAPLPKA
ncbi:hypothetical protein [Flavobacterium noncentrifugens]|uniref:Uncharacterized protein n=1 Tax=Flavobacterium noncentrifugens TaxID=1128970 RepID=A0A1G8S8S0_9FLAO|nr:hypothetical protein [Flavobacterium noncentrifugens]SDJ25597.1 hypothetical protein SAMN04487935_0453 [Flavobacterium noncentrifugens]